MPPLAFKTRPWADPANASVLDSAWQKTARTLGQFLGVNDPESQMMAIAAPVEVPGGGPKTTIRAYHGSPHDFDQFSLSKIGTGEGGQAYGHGLYFAENPAVAAEYRKMGEVVPAIGNKSVSSGFEEIAHDILSSSKSLDDALRMADDVARPQGLDAAALKRVVQENYGKPVGRIRKGATYEVNLHASPDEFLDWDKPLSQQTQKVQDGMLKALNEFVDPQTLTGEEAYQRLVRKSGGRVAHTEGTASQAMKDAGIKGIQYLDQGSRAAGEGTKNFVVFDDKIIEIAKKYGITLPTAAKLYQSWQQGQQQQQNR